MSPGRVCKRRGASVCCNSLAVLLHTSAVRRAVAEVIEKLAGEASAAGCSLNRDGRQSALGLRLPGRRVLVDGLVAMSFPQPTGRWRGGFGFHNLFAIRRIGLAEDRRGVLTRA
jgi:hypothetical protein